jgi:hypothetical protein
MALYRQIAGEFLGAVESVNNTNGDDFVQAPYNPILILPAPLPVGNPILDPGFSLPIPVTDTIVHPPTDGPVTHIPIPVPPTDGGAIIDPAVTPQVAAATTKTVDYWPLVSIGAYVYMVVTGQPLIITKPLLALGASLGGLCLQLRNK